VRVPEETLRHMVTALDGGLTAVYLVVASLAFAGLFIALLFPKGSAESHAHADAKGRPEEPAE